MHHKIFAIVVIALFANLNSADAQLDLGNILGGNAREALGQIGEQIRGEIQQEFQNGFPQFRPAPNPTCPWDSGYQPPGNIYPPPVQTLPYYPEPVSPAPVYPMPINPYPAYQPPQAPGIQTPPIIQYTPPMTTQPVPAQPFPQQPVSGNTGNPPNQPNFQLAAGPQPQTKTSAKQPAQPEARLPEVETGGVVNLSSREYGTETGKVLLKIESLVLEAETLSWSPNRVQARLPMIPVKEPVVATVVVANAEEKVADLAKIKLVPATGKKQAQPNAPNPKLPMVAPGQPLHIKGDLGEAQGSVELRIGDMKFPVSVTKWSPARVDFKLPEITLTTARAADVIVLTATGDEARAVSVVLAGSN